MTTSVTGKKRRGLTFIELFIVIIILGILIGVSVPAFRKSFESNQLNAFSAELQSFMNYLRQRSIVEREIVFLNIDNEKSVFWGRIRNKQIPLKIYHIPPGINIEAQNTQICFYPDGQIDRLTIIISNRYNQKVTLTTEGVFGGVKLLPQE